MSINGERCDEIVVDSASPIPDLEYIVLDFVLGGAVLGPRLYAFPEDYRDGAYRMVPGRTSVATPLGTFPLRGAWVHYRDGARAFVPLDAAIVAEVSEIADLHETPQLTVRARRYSDTAPA